jgi:DNA-binding PadR family transcriptional regulator
MRNKWDSTDQKGDNMGDQKQQTALTEAVYYILLSLQTPMHGYGIMQWVREMSGERVSLGAGTLYGAVNTLVEKGWIIPLAGPADARKKEYHITEKGRQALGDELIRLKELVESGKRVLSATKQDARLERKDR